MISELKTPTSVVQNHYVTPTSSIVSHTLKKNQQHATLQLQNHPSLGPTQQINAMQAINAAHHNAPQQNFDKNQMSGSVSSSFKESVKPFHIPTTPDGATMPNQTGVVYNHNSSATPMSNISNQLLHH